MPALIAATVSPTATRLPAFRAIRMATPLHSSMPGHQASQPAYDARGSEPGVSQMPAGVTSPRPDAAQLPPRSCQARSTRTGVTNVLAGYT
jgi:hypothetical protein